MTGESPFWAISFSGDQLGKTRNGALRMYCDPRKQAKYNPQIANRVSAVSFAHLIRTQIMRIRNIGQYK